MDGRNIYLSVFPEFLELLSFYLLKLTKNIDLQVMRVTIMLRMTRLSLSTDWNKKDPYHFEYSRLRMLI